MKQSKIDLHPNTFIYSGRSELLKAKKCEWCGAEDIAMEIHHVRKLKDLKGKKKWEFTMIAKKRKNDGSLYRMPC